MMAAQSVISLIVVGLVIARAVNVSADAQEGRHTHIEWLSTLLLAMAAIATAWSTYQSAQWRGEQASNTGKSTAARIESSEASTRAGQLTQIDIATFVQWTDATVGGNPALARFYRERFRPEFRTAFDAWILTDPLANHDAPKTPFAMPQYRVAERRPAPAGRAGRRPCRRRGGGEPPRGQLHAWRRAVRDRAVLRGDLHQARATSARASVVLGLGYIVFLGALVWLATLPVEFTAWRRSAVGGELGRRVVCRRPLVLAMASPGRGGRWRRAAQRARSRGDAHAHRRRMAARRAAAAPASPRRSRRTCARAGVPARTGVEPADRRWRAAGQDAPGDSHARSSAVEMPKLPRCRRQRPPPRPASSQPGQATSTAAAPTCTLEPGCRPCPVGAAPASR